MCDKLSHSVTLIGIEARETGNTETPGPDSGPGPVPAISLKAPFSGALAESEKVGMASAMSYVQQK